MLYAIRKVDGSIAIMAVAGDATPEKEVAKWSPVDRAEVVSIEPIDETGIPRDRTFRNAWRIRNGAIDVEMTAARDLHRAKLREYRAPKLAALDVEYQRADEAGDQQKKRDIAKRKQALRDVTKDPAIDAAKTPEQLKSVLPVVLVE